MDNLDLIKNEENKENTLLNDLQVDMDDIPSFDEKDFKSDDEYEYINKAESKEALKAQIKNLSPEIKAQEVFKIYNSNNRAYPITGHEKRVLMRQLIRDAKKGKLDKYFVVE